MNKAKKLSGLAIASAAAAIFAVTPMMASAEADKVDIKCTGINDCKGQGACKSKSNACAAKNSCKGKGWIHGTEKQCKDMGGTPLDG